MSPVRILVADDSQFMRIACKRVLETQDEFEIVGMAADGAEALEKFWKLKPDLAILDIVMLKVNGIEVARQIIDRQPDTGIVIISSYDDLAYISAIMKDGVGRRGYILKNSLADITELIRVVGAVAEGKIVLDSRITENLLSLYNQESSGESDSLTDTEQNVLQLMLDGRDTSFVSQDLGLHREEIEANAASGCAKLGVMAYSWEEKISGAVQALVNRPTIAA